MASLHSKQISLNASQLPVSERALYRVQGHERWAVLKLIR
jgi:hypothetical protein